MKRPNVGIGIIIQNAAGQILVGKRQGSHAPYYSIPGGHLELGESFEVAAIKEVLEETGLVIHDPKVISVSNNLQTYTETGLHHISVNLLVTEFEGRPQVMEPEKCAGWQWCDPRKLPQPHFEASTLAVACFLDKLIYLSP